MEKRWEAKNDDASNHEREVSTKGTSGKVLKTTLAYLIGGIDLFCHHFFLYLGDDHYLSFSFDDLRRRVHFYSALRLISTEYGLSLGTQSKYNLDSWDY